MKKLHVMFFGLYHSLPLRGPFLWCILLFDHSTDFILHSSLLFLVHHFTSLPSLFLVKESSIHALCPNCFCFSNLSFSSWLGQCLDTKNWWMLFYHSITLLRWTTTHECYLMKIDIYFAKSYNITMFHKAWQLVYKHSEFYSCTINIKKQMIID